MRNDIDDIKSDWNTFVTNVNSIIQWFIDFKENIGRMSIELMTWSYEILTKFVLHTPTVLFSSEWFSKNLLMFTGISIGVSIVLAMIEGFKRMMKKSYTSMDRVSRRLPFVILGAGLAPMGFYYAFELINTFTAMIIDIGRAQMTKGIDKLSLKQITLLEMFAFIAFDIALIGMMVPVLLQNFRRWFDLLALGVMTPVALSCWMFKSYEHLFRDWWQHIKKCSSVQLVYAVFLLIIGSLMFGVKTPDSELDIMIKMGVIIGGLWRMAHPPNILRRYLDTGPDATDMWKGAGKALTMNPILKKGWNLLRGKPLARAKK